MTDYIFLLCASSTQRLRQCRAPRAPVHCRPLDDDMLLLAARTSNLVPEFYRRFVGDFISPRAFQLVGNTPVWAADNDAFSGFNPDRFRKMLDRISQAVARGATPPVFITVPDVVGSYWRTMQQWPQWSEEIAERQLPRAFALQNGLEYAWDYYGPGALPWDDCEALFVGGDTAFKFSRVVREIVNTANLHGKWVHMGRVNSVRRMLYAKNIGCDSCDGSGMARFPTSVLLPLVRALELDALQQELQLSLPLS